ncbi:hypothetical protein ACSS6W_002313 [Trichoderma asperelloides]
MQEGGLVRGVRWPVAHTKEKMRKGIYANRPVRMRQKEVCCIEGRNIELRRIQAKDRFVRRKATLLRRTAVQKSCRARQKDSDVNLSRLAVRAIPPILNPDPDKESALSL